MTVYWRIAMRRPDASIGQSIPETCADGRFRRIGCGSAYIPGGEGRNKLHMLYGSNDENAEGISVCGLYGRIH